MVGASAERLDRGPQGRRAGPSGVGFEAKRDRGPHQRATAIGAGLNSFCTVLRQVDAVRDKVEGRPAKEDD